MAAAATTNIDHALRMHHYPQLAEGLATGDHNAAPSAGAAGGTGNVVRLVGACRIMGYPRGSPYLEAPKWPFETSPETSVQQYVRPAADRPVEAHSVRSPEVLIRTMAHLAEHILSRRTPRWWDPMYHEKFDYLYNRFRQIRQNWTVQFRSDDVPDAERLHWIVFMLRTLALRIVICSRTVADAQKFVIEKYNNAESIENCIGLLSTCLRSNNALLYQNVDTVAFSLFFAGLNRGRLPETAARFCLFSEETASFEPSNVLLPAVYTELSGYPRAIVDAPVVSAVLRCLHALAAGEWLHYLDLVCTLPLTLPIKCLVVGHLTYVRLRVIVDLCCKKDIFSGGPGGGWKSVKLVRQRLPLALLSKRLLFQRKSHCRRFLLALGISPVVVMADAARAGPDGDAS